MSQEPKIIAFCCNWCSYAAADLAGNSRLKYPHNVRIIRVMCSGMVHPELVLESLSQGADGVTAEVPPARRWSWSAEGSAARQEPSQSSHSVREMRA